MINESSLLWEGLGPKKNDTGPPNMKTLKAAASSLTKQ